MINFGSVSANSSARLTVTLIPKRAGNLSFYSSASSGVADFVETNDSALAAFDVQPGPGVIEFAVSATNLWENAGNAAVEIQRHDGAEGTIGVSFSTHDGTAVHGLDYMAAGGALTFAPGETFKTVAVPILNRPGSQCNREFTISLTNASGGAFLYGTTNLTIVILDKDLAASGSLEAVAVPPNGLNTGNGSTAFSSMTPDGRWLAFTSSIDDLVTNDSNGHTDVFLKDLQTGAIRLASVSRSGYYSANADSGFPILTPDRRYLSFLSYTTDLVTNVIPASAAQVYVQDLLSGEIRLASITPAGAGADTGLPLSFNYIIMGLSTNGRVVAFLNDGQVLAKGRPNLFVRNLQTETTTLVTTKYDDSGPCNGDTYEAFLSADGRFLAFSSSGSDIVAGFGNSFSQVYVRDLSQGGTIPISTRQPDHGPGGGPSGSPLLIANARYLVFQSSANDLVSGDDNTYSDIFVRDLESGNLRRASLGITGPCETPSASADGRFVAFRGGFRPGNGPASANSSQIYVFDSWSNTTTLVSVNCQGPGPANGNSLNPTMSAEGRYVLFQSLASDLASGEFKEGVMNLFRRDLTGKATVLLSQNRMLSGGGSENSGLANLSADGNVAVLASRADDLIYEDNNGFIDEFVWRANGQREARPRLTISREDSDVVVRWPRGATSFILQATSDPIGSTWTNLPVTNTTQFLRISPLQRGFFRLTQP